MTRRTTRRRRNEPPPRRVRRRLTDFNLRPERDRNTIPRTQVLFRPEWSQIDDARTWRPDERSIGRPAVTVGGSIAPVRTNKARTAAVPHRLQYESPFRVITCLRRKLRREVIFAVGHGGRKGRKKDHRRNERSNVEC